MNLAWIPRGKYFCCWSRLSEESSTFMDKLLTKLNTAISIVNDLFVSFERSNIVKIRFEKLPLSSWLLARVFNVYPLFLGLVPVCCSNPLFHALIILRRVRLCNALVSGVVVRETQTNTTWKKYNWARRSIVRLLKIGSKFSDIRINIRSLAHFHAASDAAPVCCPS